MTAETTRWPSTRQTDSASEGAVAAVRKEPRENGVLIAEYTPFPRHASGQHPRFGFTRDFSPSGMCLGVDASERVGDLLRVTIRNLDGRAARTSIERVVWCSVERDGRHWLGLERLTEAPSPVWATPQRTSSDLHG